MELSSGGGVIPSDDPNVPTTHFSQPVHLKCPWCHELGAQIVDLSMIRREKAGVRYYAICEEGTRPQAQGVIAYAAPDNPRRQGVAVTIGMRCMTGHAWALVFSHEPQQGTIYSEIGQAKDTLEAIWAEVIRFTKIMHPLLLSFLSVAQPYRDTHATSKEAHKTLWLNFHESHSALAHTMMLKENREAFRQILCAAVRDISMNMGVMIDGKPVDVPSGEE